MAYNAESSNQLGNMHSFTGGVIIYHAEVMEMNNISQTCASLHKNTERLYPCDLDGECPFGEGYGMYFCRDNCGLGVDEDN